MDSIRFNATNQTFRPEVLNHRTSSPFQQNQIQFHIGSSYLTDFTDKGIENFLSNQPGGKDLNAAEVKLFIQRVAQNAGDAKNITFDLKDAQLGLGKDDGVESRHLSGAFTLNMSDKAVLPEGQARNIRFVDVTSGSFDLKVKEDKVKTLSTELESAKVKLSGLKDKLDDARSDLATTREILGPDAQVRLDRTLNRKEAIKLELTQLSRDEADYRQMLTSPDITPERKRSLERAIASLPAEKKSLEDENRKLDETLADKSGPLLQRRSLNDLRTQMRAVDALGTEHRQFQGKVEQLETGLEAARKAQATPTAAATDATPAATPADAAAATQTGGSDAVNVGPAVDLEELRKLPPNHQATRLASMPAEQQKAAVAQLKPEERQAIQRATDGFIANLSQTQSTRISQSRQLDAYKALKETIAQAPAAPTAAPAPAAASPQAAETPVAPDAAPAAPAQAAPAAPAAAAPAQTPPAPAQTPAGPAAPTPAAPAQPPAAAPAPASAAAQSSTTTTTTTTSEISIGEAGQTLPADAISRSGRPLMHQGKVLTMSQFSSLNIKAKFDVLMTCDAEFMVDILAKNKDLRSQVRTMAQQVVDDYKTSQVNAVDTNTYVRAADGSTAVVMNVDGKSVSFSTSSYRNQESVTRAQLIIDVIDELNALDAQGRSSEYSKVKVIRNQVVKVSQGQYAYDVKPRDTASSIARDKSGSEFKNYDVFTHNPGLEPTMRARHNSQDFNRYEEDISAYQDYKQLILSTQAGPPPIGQPAAKAPAKPVPPAPAPATNPTVTVVPPAAPQARTQPAPAAQPAAPATPAKPEPAKPAPAAAPTPAKVETAPLVVEEAPVAPAQPAAPTPAKVEPVAEAPKPAEQPAEPAKPAAQPVVPATPARKPAPKNQRTS